MRIAVLLGGASVERDVSVASGRGVVQALRDAGHDVIPIDPALGTQQPKNPDDLLLPTVQPAPPTLEELAKFSPRALIECINSSLLDKLDLVFIALHGKWGEDGTLQALLEMRGVRYTGSSVLASALAMDKAMSKVMFRHVGVPTPEWFLLDEHTPPDAVRKEAARLGLPLVVKPNVGGSTVGLSIVKQASDVDAAVAEARKYSSTVLLEHYIEGKELTVAIVGDTVLPMIEIRPQGGFYDYKHKYTKGMTEYLCPAPAPEQISKYISDLALLAFRSLGCAGFARVDFRLASDGKAYCLEVNTVPGMTGTSLVPKAAAAAGLSFPALCQRIIDLALK
ncbi:MAG: D-alanine--D-alanine ligase [Ignavibacteriae bacterium]|nr:D-alanine--D-alanine ligase [Ignavibacteriota bacterium]